MFTRRTMLGSAAAGTMLAAESRSKPAGADFVGLDGWLNAPAPLTLAGLRGKVVLVEFGTYTCINWRRTLPYVHRWRRAYAADGLEVVCIHTPEFGFERVRPNIEAILPGLGVDYPVALDGRSRTWRAWQNRAWPALYVFDREGRLRLLREGEGHSAEIEDTIRSALGLPRLAGARGGDADLSGIRTGEIYFGSLHETAQDPAQGPRRGEASYAAAPGSGPRLNQYDLDGSWARGDEPLILRSATGRMRLRFSAAKMHLIAGAPSTTPVRLRLDGGPERTIEIGLPTLYTVADGTTYGEHVLELESGSPGLALYSATFG